MIFQGVQDVQALLDAANSIVVHSMRAGFDHIHGGRQVGAGADAARSRNDRCWIRGREMRDKGNGSGKAW
jgi:hypothetical protein